MKVPPTFRILAGCSALLGLSASLQAALIEQESFEAAAGDHGFSVSPGFTGSGNMDYWDRLNNNGSRTQHPGAHGNGHGSFMVGTSDDPGGGPFTLTMDPVNIAGMVNTAVQIRLAAPTAWIFCTSM